jgi:hypothetical protein
MTEGRGLPILPSSILGMTSDEDHWRPRKDHAAENLALLRKLTLNLFRHDPIIKDTIRAALCEKTPGALVELNISK